MLERLFFLAIILIACTPANSPNLPLTGMTDLDEVRQEVADMPTTPDNFNNRKAALYRFWRFLWRQGVNMRSFDPFADQLINAPKASEAGQLAIDEGFQCLERIYAAPTFIPEVTGEDVSADEAPTNWPVYHGVDGSQSGYSPDTGPTKGEVAWKFPKTNGWTPGVVLQDGKIYASGAGSDVIGYRLDAQTGAIEWKARLMSRSYYHTSSHRDTPILSDGVAYFRVGNWYHAFSMADGSRACGEGADIAVSNIRNRRVVAVDLSSRSELWSFAPEGHYIANPPVRSDSKVFTHTTSGQVVCLDIRTGEEVWSRELSAELRGPITVHADRIFVSDNEEKLYALEAKSGATAWVHQALDAERRAYEYFSKPRFADTVLYVGTAAGKLLSLSLTTGNPVFDFELDDWVRSKPVVTADAIYVATMSGQISKRTVEQGGQNPVHWEQEISPHGFTADLEFVDDILIATDQNMMMYGIDATDGSIVWRHGLLDGAWVDGEFVAAEEVSGQQSSPTIVDGTLYIAAPDGFVDAVDVESGQRKWRFETSGSCSTSPTVAFGKVFVGQTYRGFGKYFALDKDTGNPIWTTEELGSVWVNAAVDGGKLFLGNMDGFFFAVDPNTGEKLWEYYTAEDTENEDKPLDAETRHGWPPGVYCNPIVENGVVYTGSWAGYYFAFDQQTGQLLWRTRTQPEGIQGGLPDSAAPVLHKDHLYVQKAGHFVVALNKFTGAIEWEWAAPDGFLQNGTVAASDDMIIASAARKVNELPYHVEIFAFSDVPSGSRLLWSYRGGGGLTAPVLTDDHVIFGSSGDPFLTCLDRENGELVWRLKVGGIQLESVPAIYGNKAFALIKDGYLYAVQ